MTQVTTHQSREAQQPAATRQPPAAGPAAGGATLGKVLGMSGAQGFQAQSEALSPGAATLSPATGDKAAAAATATPAKPAVAPPPPVKELPADALVLSRDARYTASGYVGWFQDQVKAKVTGWGHAFAPASVYQAAQKVGAATVNVMALDWNGAWGTKPSTTEMPSDFSLAPLDARASIAGARALPGWSKVEAANQGILDNLLGGELNLVSRAARNALRPTFGGLGAKTPEEQATALQAIIGSKDAVPGLSTEDVGTVPITFTLSAATEAKDYPFRGKKADAEKYTASFSDGTSIEIVAPKAPEPGFHNHTVTQAAEAAAYLPAKNRALVNRIVLNVVTNPEDPHWAAAYNRPNFHSYMTAGAAGEVTIYPDATATALQGDNSRRGSMIHETGHVWSYKTWGTDTTKGKWVDWKKAQDADKVSVSGYAMADIAEDVAETVRAYGATKGQPQYAEYKKLVPKRWEMLEKELA